MIIWLNFVVPALWAINFALFIALVRDAHRTTLKLAKKFGTEAGYHAARCKALEDRLDGWRTLATQLMLDHEDEEVSKAAQSLLAIETNCEIHWRGKAQALGIEP